MGFKASVRTNFQKIAIGIIDRILIVGLSGLVLLSTAAFFSKAYWLF